MYSLGTTVAAILPRINDEALGLGFVCNAIAPIGTVVKVMNDGTVSPIAATTDKPFGIVVSGTKVSGGKVTVLCAALAEVFGQADGAVVAGTALACSGNDGTTLLPKFKTATTGDMVIAFALANAADTAGVRVAYLYTPYKI